MKAIGLDLDGTLYNWHQAVLEFHQIYRGFGGTYEKFWGEFYKTLTNEDWEFLINVDTFYSSQFPTDDCQNFLNNVKCRFDIYYLTSRPEYVKLTTQQYMRRFNFPSRDNLIFDTDKVNIARRLKLSYCLDDMPKHIESLSKVTNVILMAQPYNKHMWNSYNTAHSLMSALQYLED